MLSQTSLLKFLIDQKSQSVKVRVVLTAKLVRTDGVFHRSMRCPGGEIGRHKGFKIPRLSSRAGSSPARGTIFLLLMQYATLAQLVERNLAKVEVTSSNLVCRSRFFSKKRIAPHNLATKVEVTPFYLKKVNLVCRSKFSC